MPAKIISAVLTLLLNIAAGIFGFVMLLVVLNGFHETDANYGIIAYIALALAISLGMAAAAFFTVHLLMKREISPLTAALIAVPVVSLIGFLLKIAAIALGALMAEIARQSF